MRIQAGSQNSFNELFNAQVFGLSLVSDSRTLTANCRDFKQVWVVAHFYFRQGTARFLGFDCTSFYFYYICFFFF